MKTIYKYPLKIASSQIIEMPIDAKILDLQMQGNIVTILALVDTDKNIEKIQLLIYCTGEQIERDISKLEYIGTFQTKFNLLFHFFKVLQ